MKKFFTYLLCGLWLAGPALAQTTSPVVVQPPTGSDPGDPAPANPTPTDPTRATLDNLFAPLNKSQVPTGFLAEDALPLVPLDVFNGTLTDSSRTSPDGFRYLYATLYSAHVYGNHPLLSVQDYNARTAAAIAAAGPTVIPVMVQRVEYATVRSDAFSANLLAYSNGQVRDVAGRTQSPYLVRTAFAAAPTSSYSTTSTVSLVLSSALEVRSTGVPISNRYLDFGDGRGYLVANPDQPLTASYSTPGPKRIKVRYTYSNTQVLESWFDITILDVATSPAAANVGSGGTGPSPLGAFDENIAPIAGVRAGGTAHFKLGRGHTQITKPFIVAEGFDPSFVAPLIQENVNLDYFTGVMIQTPGTFNYYNNLYKEGYDIIYIDYKNGTDNILLNAALFKEVINRVNASKVGTEQNVVLGISMGGLVARYGLADMEKAQPGSTQTRLLILQDSPQRGANVPLGFQALVRQSDIDFGFFRLSDAVQILKQALTLLDQPASQQLLLYRATNASGGFAANTFLDGVYRQKITFGAGQQPPYKIVAASQGSQCGTQLFNPYAELIRGDGGIFLSPFPWIRRRSYNAQVVVNALPANGQSNRVSTLQFYTVLRLFSFINIRTNFVRQDYSCPSGLLAVDGIAGGTQYIGARLDPTKLPSPRHNSFGPFFDFNFNYSLVREFCFVPTASALDLADFNQTSFTGKFINGIASTSSSRTDGFIAQEGFPDGPGTYYNQFHTTFTARNSEWMFDVMENKAFASSYCSSDCSAIASITGPSQICSSPTSVFSVNTAQVTWTATPSYLFTIDSGTGSQFATAAAAGAQGSGTITATFPCGPPLTKTVSVGGAYPTGQYRYNGAYNTLTGTNFIMGYNNPVTIFLDQPYNFTFTSNDPAVILFNTTSTSTSFSIPSSVTGTVKITATAAGTGSDCGISGGFIFSPSGYSYQVAPNPASSELTVSDGSADPAGPATAETSSAAGTDASAASKTFTAELYDTYGKKVKAQKSARGRAVLNVRDVPNGLYNLRVGTDSKPYSQHIQITH